MGNVYSERVRQIIRMTMADTANLADERVDAIGLENADTDVLPPLHIIKATRARTDIKLLSQAMNAFT